MDNQIRELSKKNERKRMLKRVISLLCVIVLLFTMNTLKRSANTLERIAMCGLEEHIHDSSCYNEAGELVCGRQEHVHTDACYQESPKKNGKSGDLDVSLDGFDNTGNLVDSGDVQGLDLSTDLNQEGLLDFVQDSNGSQGSDNVMERIDGDLQPDIPKENGQESQAAVANSASETPEVSFEFAGEAQSNAAQTSSIANAQQPAEVVGQPVDDGQQEEAPAVVGQPVTDDNQQEEEPAVVGQPVDDEQEEPAVAGQPVTDDGQQEEPAVVGQPVDDEQQEEPAVAGQPVDDEQEEPAVAGQPVTDDGQQEEPAVVGQPVDDEQQEEPAVAGQPADDNQQEEEPAVAGQPVTDDNPQEEAPAVDGQPADDNQQEEAPAVDGQSSDNEQQEEAPAVDGQSTDDGPQEEAPAVDGQTVTDDNQQEEAPAVDGQSTDDGQQEEAPAVDGQSVTDDNQQEEAPAVDGQSTDDGQQEEAPAVDGQSSDNEQQEEAPAVDGQPADDNQQEEEPAADGQSVTDDNQQEEEPAVAGQSVTDDNPQEEEPAVAGQPETDDNPQEEAPAVDGQSVTDDNQQEEEPAVAGQPETDDNPQEEAPAVDGQSTDDEQQEEAPAVEGQSSDSEQQEEAPAVDGQSTDDEQQEEAPAVDGQSTDDEQQEEAPAVDGEPVADDQQEEEPAVAGQPVDDDEQREAQSPERRYTATVDLAGTETYPLSLRGMIANAIPAEGFEVVVDDAGEPSETDDAAELPVDKWSIEFDSGLFIAETADDDVLITPQADFESTEIIISNGSRYELTLTNCVLEQPEEVSAVETEPEIARPAQHFEQATDYISVVVDAPEGAFPEGTVMVVRDVVDQDTIDNIEQRVTEDFVEVKSVHAVDISFWYNDVEIEPSKPISVVMSAVEVGKQQQTQDAVVVHVADDGDAQVVDSEETGTGEASLKMPAGEPASQAFEADTFSVYALVMTEKIETKYIDDSGETWSIKVGFTKDAKIPAGATLQVSEITDESYLTEAEAALEGSRRITKARFFDIRIMDGDREVQPEDKVQVTVTLEGDAGTVESDQKTTEVGDSEVCAMHFVEENDEVVKVETKDATETSEGVTFDAEGFSVWGVVYTVDFFFNGIEFGIVGGSGVYLSELAEELKLYKVEGGFAIEDVQDVVFSDPELVGVEKTANEFGEEDWLLISRGAFSTDETLTIYMKDGRQIVIDVKDDQYNLEDFITDAKLTIDGRTYGSGEAWPARPDVDYNLKLTFTEKGSRQFPGGGSEMVMNLPAGLTFKAGTSGTFDIPVGYAGTVTGNRWWIDDQGKVHIQFGNDPDDLLTRSSNIHIDLDFIASFSSNVTTFSFNDHLTDTVTINDETDIDIQKTGYYDPNDNKIHYTLTVKSTGTTQNIKITDHFPASDLMTLDQNSIVINPAKAMVTGAGFEETSAAGFIRTIAEMSHNETVTINYTASVNFNSSALGENGHINGQAGKNTVSADTGDKHDDAEHIINEIRYSDISKASTSSTDKGDGTVELEWKIVANEGRRKSIAGGTITDTIGYNSKDIMHYAVETSGDHQGQLALTIVRKDGSGVVSTTTEYVNVALAYANGPERWVYNVPASDGNYTYEITYKTIATKQTLNTTVTNDSHNDDGGDTSGAGIVPGTENGGGGEDEPVIVAKTATRVTEEYVDWNIVISVPSTGFDSLVVTDDLPWQYGPKDDFADTLLGAPTVTGLVGGEDFTWTDTAVNGYWKNDPQSKYLKKNGEPLGRHIVTLTFYKDQAHTQTGLTASARTLTISLRTKNDQDWLDFAAGEGGTYYDTHTNHAKVNNTSVEAVARPVKSTLTKVLQNKLDSLEFRSNNYVSGPYYYYDIQISNVTSTPFVIEDTFDTSLLELVHMDTLSGESRKMHKVRYGDHDYDRHHISGDSDQYYPTYEETSTGIRITVSDANLVKKEDGSYYPYYDIYYILRLKDGVRDSIEAQALLNGGTYKIRNTAVWNGVEDSYDLEFTVPMLDKKGALVTGKERVYHYTVTVNPDRRTVNGGQDYTLTDTHSNNLSVDYTTVQVHKNDSSANDDSVHWNFDGNTGTFTLKDATKYVIEYDALILGTGTQTFSNNVEMKGFHAETTNTMTFSGSASGGGDIFQIKLLKYEDGKTSIGLEGATFQLFRDDGNGGKMPMKWGVGTETEGKVGENITFTTDDDGRVTVALDQTRHGNELEADVKYYLKEIETPAGHRMSDGAPEYWEFTLTKNPDEVCYGTGGQWIYFCYNDIMKMPNTPTDQPVTVEVNKQWLDKNGQEITDVDLLSTLTAKVQLYRKTNNNEYIKVRVETSGETVTITEVADDSGEVELNADNKWAYSWPNLPRVSGKNKYAYKVEEIEAPDWTVSVSETENKTTKTYSFVNHEIPDNKDTSVTVNKVWKDVEGNDVAAGSELEASLPKAIQFYLYQVSSREPFTGSPLSGGTAYVKTGDSHLVKSSADPEDDDYGLYQITNSDSWTATINGLPMVRTTDQDGTMYYAYYVREVPVEGYVGNMTVTTTTDAQSGVTTTSIGLTNQKLPEPIDLTVQKAWKDDAGETMTDAPSQTVLFHLYQVSGNTPFGADPEDWPASGGTLYTVKLWETLNNYNFNVWDGDQIVEGTYKLKKDSPGLSVTFSGLPSYSVDEKGKPTYYAYYVDEVAVEGYTGEIATAFDGATGYTITMTNTQIPKYTSITADKAWLNRDGGATLLADKTDADAVTLDVYRIEGDSLPAGVAVINGTETALSDLMHITVLGRVSTNVVTGKVLARAGDTIRVSLTKDSKAGEWNDIKADYGTDNNANSESIFTGSGGHSSYSGSFTANSDSLYVKAGPGWTQDTTATLAVENTSISSVQYKLTQEEAAGIVGAEWAGELTLNKSNGWHDTLSNLRAESQGTKYTYFVVERDGEEYQAEYVYDGTTVHITNREKDMLEVDKKWLNASGSDYTVSKNSGTITFDLYQVENAASWSDVYSGTGHFEVNTDNLRVLTNNGLASVASDRIIGNDGRIKSGSRVKITFNTEDQFNSPLDGNISVSGATIDSDEYTVVRTDGTYHSLQYYNNYQVTSHSRTIIVSNVTGDIALSGSFNAKGSSTTYTVTITVLGEPVATNDPSDEALTQTKVGTATVGYNSASMELEPAFASSGIAVSAGKTKPWSALFSNLPTDGPNNATYTYYVVETAISGFNTTYEDNPAATDGVIKIINEKQPTGSLRVEKDLQGLTYADLTSEQKAALANITFTVTGTAPNAYSATINLAQAMGGKVLTDLPLGPYTVTESRPDNSTPGGYQYKTTTVQVDSADATEAVSASATVTADTVTTVKFVNEYEHNGSLRLKKAVIEDGDPVLTGRTYFFTLQPLDDDGQPQNADPLYIKLWITNNQVDDYRVMTKTAYERGSGYYDKCNDNTTLPDVVFGRGDSEGFAVIRDLEEGDYLLTEIDPEDGSTATIVRGDGETTDVVDEANRSVRLHVTAGVANPAANTAAVATFTNSNVTLGAIKLKKIVTVGGGKPGDHHDLVDGAYDFSITGPEGVATIYVRIIVENGVMTKYTKRTDRNISEVDWHDLTDFTDADWAVIDRLTPGAYRVEELGGHRCWYEGEDEGRQLKVDTDSTLTGVSLAAIAGGTVEGSATTVTVVAGQEAETTFTNDYQYGALVIRKAVSASDDEAIGTRADGTYEFLVEGPGFLGYIEITIENGQMSTAKVWDGTKYVALTGEDIVFASDTGVTISGLILGEYTVEESESFPGNLPDGAKMMLGDITVSPADGNSVDVIAKKAKVNVTGGATPSVTATFTNVVIPDTTEIKVRKKWYDAAGTELSKPWDEAIQSITFNVTRYTQTKKNGSGVDGGYYVESGVVTFNGNDTLTLSSQGKRLLLEQATPGSVAYTATEQTGGDPWALLISGLEKYRLYYDENNNTMEERYAYRIKEISVNGSGNQSVIGFGTTYVVDDGAETAEIELIYKDSSAYILNKQINEASLILSKALKASTNSPVDGDIEYTDGTYTFTVTGPNGAASPVTRTVTITTAHGAMSGATIDGVDAGSAFDVAKGVTVSGLTPGVYTVTETEMRAPNAPAGSEMYVEGINYPAREGNTGNLKTKTATVLIGAGETSTVEVKYTNELGPDTVNHRKMVLDTNDSLYTEPFHSGSENTWEDSADYDINDLVPYRITGYLPQKTYRSKEAYYYEIEDVMQNQRYESGTGHMFAFVKGPNDEEGTWYQVDEYFDFATSDTGSARSGWLATGGDTITTLTAKTKETKGLKAIERGKKTYWGAGDTHENVLYEPSWDDGYTGIDADNIQYLQLRYKAKLLSSANIGTDGNANDARIKYTKDSGIAETGWDRNRVFTYRLQVSKTYDPVRNDSTGGDAVFALYKMYKAELSGYSSSCPYGTNATLHGYVSSGNGKDVPSENAAPTDSVYGDFYLVGVTHTAGSPEYVWNGIDDGNYILLELSAPEGYEKMPKPVYFTIDVKHDQEADDPKIDTTSNRTKLEIRSENGATNGYITNASGVDFLSGITATVPNYKTGGLNITKAIVPEADATAAAEKTFTFQVEFKKGDAAYNGPVKVKNADVYSGSGNHSRLMDLSDAGDWVSTGASGILWLEVKGTGTAEITKIPHGVTCTVTEPLEKIPEGYVLRDISNGTVTVDANAQDTPVTVVSNYRPGSLQVTKTVLVNGAAATEANKSLANGTFVFTIAGTEGTDTAGVSRTVSITYTDGVATAYQIGDAEPVPIPAADQANTYAVTVSDLIAGVYTVTETPVNGFSTTAEGGTSVSEDNAVTVTVTAGETTPAQQAQAAFTNRTAIVDLKIVKVDKNKTSSRLSGAQFQMKRKLPGESQFTVFENDAFERILPPGKTEEADKQNIGPFAVNPSGETHISGLLPGEYEVAESKSPSGYIILNNAFTFTVNADGTVTLGENVVADDVSNAAMVTYVATDNTFTVKNEPGVILPATGGSGTGWIYAAGAGLLLLAALALILIHRRRSEGAGIR